MVTQENAHQRTPALITENPDQHWKGAAEQQREVVEDQVPVDLHPCTVHPDRWCAVIGIAQVATQGVLLIEQR
ncbi:hypothetical protein D3C73_1468040 [compost metagenome]